MGHMIFDIVVLVLLIPLSAVVLGIGSGIVQLVLKSSERRMELRLKAQKGQSSDVVKQIEALRAELAGSPPAFILTAGFDPLCDEGIAYAHALDATGVQSCHVHMPGQIHGFITMGGMIPAAGTALDMAACLLRQAWMPKRA